MKTSTSVEPVTQVVAPMALCVLRPQASAVMASGHGTTVEPAGATKCVLRQPAFGYVVRVPKTQHVVVLRVNTKRLSEQERIEKANESIERFGRLFFY